MPPEVSTGRLYAGPQVATGVARVGGSSFTLDQAAYQDETCVALAVCVMVKAVAGRPVPLTETERERLAGLMFAGAESGGPLW